ncbi:nuclear transport factor 2 family protein [Sphingomonas sp.]|uniref:YybH family protein n=1 Tax=Sphingomonas sp. TaxID=28214 RepID=UPI00286C96F3|nr:nuclear transport factor 2 family protein [Sphingomonas sp.]
MRRLIVIAVAMVMSASLADARSLSASDKAAIGKLPQRLTHGWLRNDRNQVMGIFAPEATFIPHDGVRPRRGWTAMQQFWFPAKGTAGTVTAFTMTADGVSGDDHHAIVWGKSDLHWQDQKTAYHWPGYYLMAARRSHGKWLVTHLMSSDEQPTSQAVKNP